jgi:choline dehydrogenase
MDRRWDSAIAYYQPVEKRRNLSIIHGTAKRLTWATSKRKCAKKNDNCVVADGVEYLDVDGKSHFIEVKREAIICAGAVRTPLILESSGIGNPRSVKFLFPVLMSLLNYCGTES